MRRLQDAAYCAGLDDRPVGLGSTGRDGASNTIRCCPGLREVDIVSEIRQGGRVRHKLVRSRSEHECCPLAACKQNGGVASTASCASGDNLHACHARGWQASRCRPDAGAGAGADEEGKGALQRAEDTSNKPVVGQ